MQILLFSVLASNVFDFIPVCEPSSGIPRAGSVAQDALRELDIHTGWLILNTVMGLGIDLGNKVRRVCVYFGPKKEKRPPSQFK